MAVGSAGSVAGGDRVSELFDPAAWKPVDGFDDLTDITYHRAVDQGTVRIAFDRPEVRNAFRPHTVDELYRVARPRPHRPATSGCVLLTGNGPSPKDGGWAFCSGGDQRIRGRDGYQYAEGDDRRDRRPGAAGPAAHPRGAAADPLHAQDRDLRGPRLGGRRRAQPARRLPTSPWPAASTPGSSRPTPTWPASTAASGRRTSPARSGQKFAREIFFLGDEYSAEDGAPDGHGQRGRPHADLERGGPGVGAARSTARVPTAQRMLKFSFNLIDDGLVGQQVFAGEATRLAYMTDEAQEGRDAFLEKREPDWSDFPFYY